MVTLNDKIKKFAEVGHAPKIFNMGLGLAIHSPMETVQLENWNAVDDLREGFPVPHDNFFLTFSGDSYFYFLLIEAPTSRYSN